MGDAVLDMLNAQRAGGIAMPPGSAGPLSMDAPPQGMMPQGMMWPQQQQMPGQPGQEGQYAPQQHYAQPPMQPH